MRLGTSETAKRARLERIVRAQKPEFNHRVRQQYNCERKCLPAKRCKPARIGHLHHAECNFLNSGQHVNWQGPGCLYLSYRSQLRIKLGAR